ADVTAADRSSRALELARKLATDAEEGIATREWSPERPLPDGQFDLISMGHLLNELPEERRVPLVESALARLRPRGSVVIIEPAPGRVFRIGSEQLEGKGRQRFMGCGPEGRVGLALQHKHVRPENEAFMNLQRGDVIEISGTEPKGDGFALGESSQVRVIAPA